MGVSDEMNKGDRYQDESVVQTLTDSTFEMVHVDSKRDSISSSLPAAEEVRASIGGSRYEPRKTRNCLLLGLGCFFTLAIVAVVLAVTLPKSKGGAIKEATDGSTTNESAPRTTDFDSVVDFLVKHEISDFEDLQDNNSAQYHAALWLAEDDPQKLAVPTDTKRHDTEGYLFVARYVMALNYYAMGGEGWVDQLNFLSGEDICEWNNAFLKAGVACLSNMPVQLFIRKFICVFPF